MKKNDRITVRLDTATLKLLHGKHNISGYIRRLIHEDNAREQAALAAQEKEAS